MDGPVGKVVHVPAVGAMDNVQVRWLIFINCWRMLFPSGVHIFINALCVEFAGVMTASGYGAEFGCPRPFQCALRTPTQGKPLSYPICNDASVPEFGQATRYPNTQCRQQRVGLRFPVFPEFCGTAGRGREILSNSGRIRASVIFVDLTAADPWIGTGDCLPESTISGKIASKGLAGLKLVAAQELFSTRRAFSRTLHLQ